MNRKLSPTDMSTPRYGKDLASSTTISRLTTDVTTLNQKAWRLSWTTTARMIFRIEQFRMAK